KEHRRHRNSLTRLARSLLKLDRARAFRAIGAAMKVGFIGLGAMGFPMAQRVIKAGFPLITTFHRRREPADALASLGAKVVRTPAEVAREADVIVTILPADLELEQTILGAEGVLGAMAPGKVLVEMTTGTAMSLLKIEKAVEAAGAHVLDAPVSGGTS